jgi:hypothetical protein
MKRWMPTPKHQRASRSDVSGCCPTAASFLPTAGRSNSAGAASDVPKALIEARGEVAGKDALMARVWPYWIVQHLPNPADYTQA